MIVAVLTCGGEGCSNESMSGRTSTDGAAACGDAFTQPVPQSTLPNMPGCYKGVDGGWIPVLCGCQLPLDNMTASSATFVITLATTLTSPAPALAGGLDVEVSFDDPDESWYLVWAQQPANGTDYVTTKMEGKTTVRLGVTDLVLAPVPLSACGARIGTARISGTYDPSWANLSLQMAAATLGHGAGAATSSATCHAPVPL